MSDGALSQDEINAIITGVEESKTVDERIDEVDAKLRWLDKERFMLEIRREALIERKKEEAEKSREV